MISQIFIQKNSKIKNELGPFYPRSTICTFFHQNLDWFLDLNCYINVVEASSNKKKHLILIFIFKLIFTYSASVAESNNVTKFKKL